MSVEIAWKQNILVTDSNLLKSLLVVFGFGSQAFICEFSRQNICSVVKTVLKGEKYFDKNIIKYIVKLFGPAPQETNPGLTKILLLTSPFFETSPPHVFSHQQLRTPFPPHPKKG